MVGELVFRNRETSRMVQTRDIPKEAIPAYLSLRRTLAGLTALTDPWDAESMRKAGEVMDSSLGIVNDSKFRVSVYFVRDMPMGY